MPYWSQISLEFMAKTTCPREMPRLSALQHNAKLFSLRMQYPPSTIEIENDIGLGFQRQPKMATVVTTHEQRILLRNVSWDTYERLVSDQVDCSAPRLTFDRGELEIMSPSPEHERYNDAVRVIIDVLADELSLEIESLGATTFKREDIERGFEPDSCFYVKNESRVRGKTRIDLCVDPPPDFIVEIDISNDSRDKFPIYGDLGVPEVWLYNGVKLTFFKLDSGLYVESAYSDALPIVASADLTELMEMRKTSGRTSWLRAVRLWALGLQKDHS
jgi:Uma2 family endonuclease